MKPKVEKALRITIGIAFLVFSGALLLLDLEWARIPWALLLIIICLSNFFSNFRSPKMKDE